MNKSDSFTTSRWNVLLRALIRYLLAFAFVGLILFVSAGTIKYKAGWIFIAGLFVPMTFTLLFLLIKDPELLEKRMKTKEKQSAQKKYLRISLVLFVLAYILPGLDYRFHWSDVPAWLTVLSLIVMIGGYIMFIVVMIQNRYASRVIEIQNNQKLIDTGLYSVVRHPMYLAASILYIASVLVLGSYYALIPMLFLPFLLALRMVNEEKLLIKELPGYKEYTQKVKYRMIPYVW